MSTPLVRGSGIQSASANSYTVTWPTGTQAGDLAIIFGGHAYGFNNPSGWTIVRNTGSAQFWCGGIWSKVLNSTDIANGSVAITTLGTFNGVVGIVTVQPVNLGTIREGDYSRNSSGSSFIDLATTSAVLSTDLGIYFGSNRGASNDTADHGSQLQQINAANASGCLYSDTAMPGGVETVRFSYSVAGSGNFQAIVCVKLQGDVTESPTGNALAISEGSVSVTPAIAVLPSGNSLAASAHSVVVSIISDASVAAAGCSLAVSPGDVLAGPITVVALTGNALALQQGSVIAADNNISVNVTGKAMRAKVGSYGHVINGVLHGGAHGVGGVGRGTPNFSPIVT